MNNEIILSKEVNNCLENDMKINMDHFLSKYNSFDNKFKIQANKMLSELLLASKNESKFKKDAFFYENGDSDQNEFLDAMYQCFKLLSSMNKDEVYKGIYEHVNRGGENWFPVVVISKPEKDYSDLPAELTVYRGCSLESFKSGSYRDRQSWTTDFDTAKAFAFTHYDSYEKDRVVIKTTVSKADIFWMRAAESEVVLNPNFKPLSEVIKLDYEQCNQGGQI